IAQMLSAEFNKKYDHIKTYYLTKDFKQLEKRFISKQRWLVLMREKETDSIWIGTGFYDWKFKTGPNNNFKIKHHHITIGVMLNLPDQPLQFLLGLQTRFSYPWVAESIVMDVIKNHMPLLGIKNYLEVKDNTN
ncbi:MAG: hypothetical protein GY729_11640, partial [Desulfobacteraceae bacterium]|nr:hypothetical protein [Desulfobacteraceae bacterium]